ncbi:BTAD domain-containing putative transcriptional regulator [Streptomyces sp. CWNU-52B]|uniref:BTAD domain-containing putative transcriptional regulator n=1 Tax=unclassified Streptomyces TaxID=2593676 RepID=UPI0039C1B038
MDNQTPIALGGGRRRATLGLLLLNANREVATSRLLEGLWDSEETPLTARKILQNAVRGLRVMFAEHAQSENGPPTLLTCPHGYQLQVDPERVDMFRFHRQAEAGRAELAAGRPGAAAVILREALALWRGRALADMVEAGHSWTELTALQSARLNVMEDYYEAELANGRHQAVLSDLEAMVEAEPLRERACYQLMLALYRSGRQADALAVYRRVRQRLAQQIGLEPGRELRLLQHAVLVHDPFIAAPAGPVRAVVTSGSGRVPEQYERRVPPSAPPAHGGGGGSVSAVLIRMDFGDGSRGADLGRAMECTAKTVREEVERFGGVIAGATGSVTLALFKPRSPQEARTDRAAGRAIGATKSLRQRICSGVPDGERPELRIAVSTRDISARPDESHPGALPVNGSLLVDCESLLQFAESGEIVVCDRTRRLTMSAIHYGWEGGAHARWTVRERCHEAAVQPAVVDREPELAILSSLLERVRHRARPHLVLVLGDQGIGKTPLLEEFERRVENASTVRLGPGGFVTAPDTAIPAGQGPLVVFVDDLHRADNVVLESIEDLLDPPMPMPVLVVVAARPELFRRRPGWGAGQQHVSRMTLEQATPVPHGGTAHGCDTRRLCQPVG